MPRWVPHTVSLVTIDGPHGWAHVWGGPRSCRVAVRDAHDGGDDDCGDEDHVQDDVPMAESTEEDPPQEMFDVPAPT